MYMNKERYERLSMDVTEFDAEDIITTSAPAFAPGSDEMGTGGQISNGFSFPAGDF